MMVRELITLVLSCSLWVAPSFAQSSTQPDNTRENKAAGVTADQQNMNMTDRQLTKKIRQAVVADKSLSTYAHNVKIISQNGTVTLKGPVRSDAEKSNIEAKAAEIAGGSDKVKSEISVKQ